MEYGDQLEPIHEFTQTKKNAARAFVLSYSLTVTFSILISDKGRSLWSVFEVAMELTTS